MLLGKNIILRPLKNEDLSLLNKWRNDLEIKIQAQSYRLPVCEEKDKEWLNKYMLDRSNTIIYFGIEEINTKELIGTIQLFDIDWISRIATWGFIIGDKSKRGKGYSVEAPKLLFDYAFNVLNLRKIIGYPASYNEATLKMHKKIGNFVEEGCLRKHVYYNNSYHDVFILSLFKEDFKM